MKRVANLVKRLFLISLLVSSDISLGVDCPYQPGCVCYEQKKIDKIAGGLTELKKCRNELAQTKIFLEEKMIKFDEQAATSFWQEPSFIIGGMAVSMSIGAALVFLVVR